MVGAPEHPEHPFVEYPGSCPADIDGQKAARSGGEYIFPCKDKALLGWKGLLFEEHSVVFGFMDIVRAVESRGCASFPAW